MLSIRAQVEAESKISERDISITNSSTDALTFRALSKNAWLAPKTNLISSKSRRRSIIPFDHLILSFEISLQ